MEYCLDFFNYYIMGSIQVLVGFHYFTKFLKKDCRLAAYMLFLGLGVVVATVVPSMDMHMFLAMLAAWGIFIYRESLMAVMLCTVVTGGIMQLCYGILNSILCILYPFLFSFSLETVGRAFVVLGNTAIFAVISCCRGVYRHFVCNETGNGQHAALILLPVSLVFLLSEYISFTVYGNTVSIDGRGKAVGGNHGQMLVMQLMGVASLFCVMAAYKRLMENVRVSTELSLLRQREHFLNQYVAEARAHYESTKSIRHDIRNHITVVKELLQSGMDGQALQYVTGMDEITREMSFPCGTGNPVVDILVGNKMGIAKRNGIDVSCSLALPYPCPVRDIDLCIILSNALDNAVSACRNLDRDGKIPDQKPKKHIYLSGKAQGDFLLIEIENSFDGSGMFEEGTGLSNIRKAAGKYHGTVDLQMDDRVVRLRVLLIVS